MLFSNQKTQTTSSDSTSKLNSYSISILLMTELLEMVVFAYSSFSHLSFLEHIPSRLLCLCSAEAALVQLTKDHPLLNTRGTLTQL